MLARMCGTHTIHHVLIAAVQTGALSKENLDVCIRNLKTIISLLTQ